MQWRAKRATTKTNFQTDKKRTAMNVNVSMS